MLSEILENCLGEDENLLLADGFEEAFLGIGRQFRKPFAVYDREKCLEVLMDEGAYVGEQTPIFLER